MPKRQLCRATSVIRSGGITETLVHCTQSRSDYRLHTVEERHLNKRKSIDTLSLPYVKQQ